MHVASQSFIPASRELVINWHVTEACNYRCRYCYAHWEEGTKNRELLHDEAACRRLLEQLAAWDGSFVTDRIEPTVFSQMLYETARAAMQDEFGPVQFRNLLGTRALAPLRHGFSHFRLTLNVLRADVDLIGPGVAEDGRQWLPLVDVDQAALPAPIKKLLRTQTA